MNQLVAKQLFFVILGRLTAFYRETADGRYDSIQVAVTLLAGSLIPIVGMLVVLMATQAVPGIEWIHGSTAVAAWMLS